MKDVLILVTLRPLMKKAEKIIAEEGLERVEISLCKDVNGMLKFVMEELPETIEVILSMPGTAMLLENKLRDQLPVLPIEYNNIDIIKALREALSYCPGSVALAHYKEENPRINDIREMVGQPFMNFLFGDDDNINRRIIKKFKEEGISAVVGGGYICNLAQEEGLSIFPLEVHRSTLEKVIKRALTIADTRRLARYSKRNIDTILKYQAEAVVTVNDKNKVTFFNKSAEKLFGLSSSEVIGKDSSAVLAKNCFEEVLKNKKTIENFIHLFNNIDIIGDYKSVLDNENIIGAVGTFSSMSNIQKKEQVVRKYYTPKDMGPHFSFDDFQGNTPRFKSLLEKAKCFALSDETVLITGESGTGKEAMANSIHNASKRRHKPFLAINCASIPATLMESELFGYVPGAFTGGKKTGSPGLFECAHEGTLFLDEIGEMPFELQSKLLRVIQEKKVRRLGDSKEIPVDVRIIAATNRILEQEVAQHRFRVDLYYRINILHIHMLPLREYADSIEDIALKMLISMKPDADKATQRKLQELLKKLSSYDWPGNVRELENIIRRYVALNPFLKRPVSLGDIFTRPILHDDNHEDFISLQEQEHRKILEVFNRLHGNRALMANELGISRSTLWRKLKLYNLC